MATIITLLSDDDDDNEFFGGMMMMMLQLVRGCFNFWPRSISLNPKHESHPLHTEVYTIQFVLYTFCVIYTLYDIHLVLYKLCIIYNLYNAELYNGS